MEFSAAAGASQVTSQFAAQQFRHADSDHARSAVLLEIDILGKLERATPDRGRRGQLGYAFTRLAMIEDSANHRDAAQQALGQAKSWFKKNSGKGLTDDQMKQALKQIDDALDRL